MHFGDSDDPWTLMFACNLHRCHITKQMASRWCPSALIKSLLLIISKRGPLPSSPKLVSSSSLANKTNSLTLSSSLTAAENFQEFGDSILFLLCHTHSTRGLLEAWRLQTLSSHFRFSLSCSAVSLQSSVDILSIQMALINS